MCLAAVEGARAQPDPASDALFATVGDAVITQKAYAQALRRAMRQRYYHGAPPRAQQQSFRQEVARDLIDRVLLLQEARRRGLQPDLERVDQALQRVTRPGSSRRQGHGAADETYLRARLTEEDLLHQLQRRIRDIPPPAQDTLRAYYRTHPERFTEPARRRVSLILLKVDPSSAAHVWQAAVRKAEGLVRRLRAGADFARLAQRHSDDPTAAQGGDMGYLHQGMLGAQAEAVIAALEQGEISDPLRVLEGVAILRLDEFTPAALRPYSQVRHRVQELWRREQAEAAWQALKARLWETTPMQIHHQSFRHETRPAAGRRP